jgi:DNA processing protein
MNPQVHENSQVDDRAAALRLSLVSGIGPQHFADLVAAFGTPSGVLRAAPAELRSIPGIGTKLAREISLASESDRDVAEELERCRQFGIDIVVAGTPQYPTRLAEISDPPSLLFVRGQLEPRDALAIAVVGTRHPTTYGKAQAERLARGLALAGLTVVSGLARGIDSIAHRAALAAGGRTFAVLGSGLLNLYPPEHLDLADAIAERGALLSEFPTLQPPKSGAFPRRNRILSGLSLGVLVIEAADRSGALITARHAAEQGRDVFAVPGRIDSRNSRGCHHLIRDGAKLVQSIDDVLSELWPLPVPARIADERTVHHPAELNLNPREIAVLECIQKEPTSVDALVAHTQLPVQQILAVVSALEMRRLIRRAPGSTFIRV